MPPEGRKNPLGSQRPASDGGEPRASSGPGPAAAASKKMTPNPLGWMVLIGVVLLLVLIFQTVSVGTREVTWQEFQALYAEGSLSEIRMEDRAVMAKKRPVPPETVDQMVQFPIPVGAKDSVYQDLKELTGGGFRTTSGPAVWMQILFSPLLLTILFFVVLWMLIARGLRGASGPGGMLGNFGKSRHRLLAKESTGVTFADVAGVEEAKDEVTEIVEFLRNPKKFMRLGGRIPRGVLLVGDPGCGKTLLAKAIAGEADVPFFSISGSDFVEMFVGVGASRVRDLFKQAKESSPCIIFLDEIDAVGRRRGGGFSTGGHDEREQTLNAILVEMDGFDTSDQIIVIAATNRADVLDPALTRPGRFDRQVIVPLPDIKGRFEILKVHARKIKLSPDVDLERIARGTPMFSGAELAAIMNEAAIMATLLDKEWVEQSDLEEARDKIRYGRSRKSRVIEEKERVATAFHEAGHAVLQRLLPDADPLHKVTIIPRGQAMGATFSLPEKDRYGYGLRWLSATMRLVCGGRIAEQRRTGDISSGAAMDITMLTQLARHMVLEWGMSDKLGFVRYSGVDTRESFMPEREYSEETARLVDEEIRRMADEAYKDAERMLEANWEKVEAVALALLKHETLTAAEVDKLMKGESLGKPTVSDLLAAERTKPRVPPPSPEPGRQEGLDAGPGLMPSPA
ncbi:MAG: ATP-dependent zinc metalloprotease FtsH [Planctomycetota bacterium]|nr:ATP-dependent zinc metalloprotease FtsH [Planctomycetota bacterium]